MISSTPPQIATYNKAIKVTVDGPREPRSKTSEYVNLCVIILIRNVSVDFKNWTWEIVIQVVSFPKWSKLFCLYQGKLLGLMFSWFWANFDIFIFWVFTGLNSENDTTLHGPLLSALLVVCLWAFMSGSFFPVEQIEILLVSLMNFRKRDHWNETFPIWYSFRIKSKNQNSLLEIFHFIFAPLKHLLLLGYKISKEL